MAFLEKGFEFSMRNNVTKWGRDLNVGVAYCLAKLAAQASFYQNSKIYSIFKSISCSNPPYCPFICGESLQFWLFVVNSLCNVQNELLVSKKPS